LFCKNFLILADEARIQGCDGLELANEIRATIAAQACFLVLSPMIRIAVFVVPTGTFKHAVWPHPWRSSERQKRYAKKLRSIASDAKKELDANLGLPETGVGPH